MVGSSMASCHCLSAVIDFLSLIPQVVKVSKVAFHSESTSISKRLDSPWGPGLCPEARGLQSSVGEGVGNSHVKRTETLLVPFRG